MHPATCRRRWQRRRGAAREPPSRDKQSWRRAPASAALGSNAGRSPSSLPCHSPAGFKTNGLVRVGSPPPRRTFANNRMHDFLIWRMRYWLLLFKTRLSPTPKPIVITSRRAPAATRCSPRSFLVSRRSHRAGPVPGSCDAALRTHCLTLQDGRVKRRRVCHGLIE